MVFSGNVQSDFLKLVGVEEEKRSTLINYAATDFVALRKSVIDYIKTVYPLDYNNFVESDLGVMLIEVVAYMGAIMSMKADMLANENYLRTARNRDNVKKLLQLVGVRMKGPIAAAANALLTLETAPWVSWGSTQATINKEDRVISITSPEDGAQISFTLYKVIGGLVDAANSTGDIVLTNTEADNYTVTGTGTAFSNLVLLEGSLVIEEGTFAANEPVKVVQLTQNPVIEGSVQVFVEGGAQTSGVYRGVDNVYFASGSSDKVFQVVTTDDFAATVVFGDNNLGISPRVGDTYKVYYRVGGGTRGNIASEVINVPITLTGPSTGQTVNGVIENSSQGTGGADAETVDHAKKYAPLTFRRQDRLVTLDDYKSFANSFISSYGSVGKATASVRRAYSSANIIDLFVLEKANNLQLRKATPTFKNNLLTAINEKKMLTDEVVIVDGLIRTLDLVLTIRIRKELRPREQQIKLQANDAILSFMSIDNVDFGKTFIKEDLSRAVFDLDDILFASVDNIDEPIILQHNEIIQLNNVTINVLYV